MSFECRKLRDLLVPKGYIRGPFGSALKRGDMESKGIPVYEQQNAIYDNRLFRYYVNESKFNELQRFQVKTSDIVLSCSGTVGKTTLIREDDPKGIISQALLILRVNSSVIIPEYLQYFFKTNVGLNSLLERSIGSVQVNIAKREVIENIDVPLPPIDEQVLIVKLLSSFDDEIITLSAINDNLSAIFESEYDKLRENYPSEMELSELCEIVKDRDSSNDLTIENYYSTENMLPNKAGVVSAATMPSDGKATRCIEGDVLVSNIRPYFKKIHYCDCMSGCSADVLCFRPKRKELSPYLYSILRSDEFFDYVVAGSKGTKMPRGDKDQIMQYTVPCPPDDVMDSFNKMGTEVLSILSNNRNMNKKLAGLLDYLLPKLMSGEIDVSTLEIPN